jgi:hypothetical protein
MGFGVYERNGDIYMTEGSYKSRVEALKAFIRRRKKHKLELHAEIRQNSRVIRKALEIKKAVLRTLEKPARRGAPVSE